MDDLLALALMKKMEQDRVAQEQQRQLGEDNAGISDAISKYAQLSKDMLSLANPGPSIIQDHIAMMQGRTPRQAFSKVLELFSRPSKAWWTGLKESTLSDDPNQSFATGAYRGLLNEPGAVEASGYLGLPSGGAQDTWPEWVGKEAGKLLVDAVGDPSNLLMPPFSLGKRGLTSFAKAVDKLYPRLASYIGHDVSENLSRKLLTKFQGSAAGKLLSHGEATPEIKAFMDTLTREGNLRQYDKLIDDMQQAVAPEQLSWFRQVFDAMHSHTGAKYEPGAELFNLIEEPYKYGVGKAGNPVNEIYDALKPALGEMDRLFNERVSLMRSLGVPEDKLPKKLGSGPEWKLMAPDDVQYFHRQLTKEGIKRSKGEWLGGQGLQKWEPKYWISGAGFDPMVWREPHREIKAWVSRDYPEVLVNVGKLGNKKTEVTAIKDPGGLVQHYIYKNKTPEAMEVIPRNATMNELLEAGILGEGAWNLNPFEVARNYLRNYQMQINQLKLLKKLKEEGLVRVPGQMPSAPISIATKEGEKLPLRVQWDQLKANVERNKEINARQVFALPGLHLEAPKAIANYLENIAKIPSLQTERYLQGIAETELGKGANKLMDFWRDWRLGSNPAFHIPNRITNDMLAADDIGLVNYLKNLLFARHVWKRSGNTGIKGLEAAELADASEIRGIVRGENLISAMRSAEPSNAPGLLEKTLSTQGTPYKILKGVQGIPEKGWAWGQKHEAEPRIAVMLQDIKEKMIQLGVDDWRLVPKEQQELILDRAARRAKDALINYELTPFERGLRNTIFPFMGWQSGMPRRFIQMAWKQPAKMARRHRLYSTVFSPLTEEEKGIAGAPISEQMPIRGVGGMRFSDILKPLGMTPGDLTMLAGRWNPYGEPEQWLTMGPWRKLLSGISPIVRAPIEMALNKDIYKQREIEPLAPGQTGATALYRTLTGTAGKDWSWNRRLFGQRVPGTIDYALRSSPFWQIDAADIIGKGLGLWKDPLRPTGTVAESIMGPIAGTRFFPIDMLRYQKKKQLQHQADLRKLKGMMSYSLRMGDPQAFDYQRGINDLQMNPWSTLESP